MSASPGQLQAAFADEWKHAVIALELARQEYRSALDKSEGELRKAARAFWGEAGVVLRLYTAARNWPEGTPQDSNTLTKHPRFALPPKLANILANQALYLHVGEVSEMMGNVKGKGRTAPGPHETRDKAIAVAMVSAVKAGALPGTVTGVAKSCGVSVRALQKWVSEMGWVSVENYGAPADLRASFEQAAERLQGAGRSARAIASRGNAKHRERK